MVLVVENNHDPENRVAIAEFDSQQLPSSARHIRQDEYLRTHNNSFLTRVDATSLKLKDKIDKGSVRLGQLAQINQAIALKQDRAASLFDSKVDETYKRVLDGVNIQRYATDWSGVYLAYDVNKIHSCKRTDIFEAAEKLFLRRVGERITATYDDEQYYALNTLVVITLRPETHLPLKFLLGLINSRLANYYYFNYLKSTKKVFSEVQARQIAEFPIRLPDSDHPKFLEDIVNRVDQLLVLKKKYADTKSALDKASTARIIEKTDRSIDKLVFDLYGLTDEEIRDVDEASS